MPTDTLTLSGSTNSAHAQSITTDSGKGPATHGTVTLNPNPAAPGSHSNNDEYTMGARFVTDSGNAPASGDTIDSATYYMTARGTYDAGAGNIVYWVSAHDADNPGVFATAGNNNLNSTVRPRTTADTTWDRSAQVDNTEYSVSITSIIQEIVDRPGWAAGNAIAIMIDTHANTATGEWNEFDTDNVGDSPPRLEITWTAAGGGDPEAGLIGGKLTNGGLLLKGLLVRT